MAIFLNISVGRLLVPLSKYSVPDFSKYVGKMSASPAK